MKRKNGLEIAVGVLNWICAAMWIVSTIVGFVRGYRSVASLLVHLFCALGWSFCALMWTLRFRRRERELPKLVRDKIPELIAAAGRECETEILSDGEYLRRLDEKMGEELAEYREAPSAEELADLIEVIYAAAKARGWSQEELERVRARKRAERGGFEKKILLKK